MVPKIFQLELTNFCTLDCFFCPHSKMKRPKGYINLDLFKLIIDRDAVHTDRLGLYMMGESLLHPDVYKMISYVKSKGIAPELATNSTLLDTQAKRMEFVNSNLSFVIFDVTKGKTSKYMHKHICDNIINLIKLKPDFDYVIQCIDYKQNNWMYETFEGFENKISVKFIDTWAGEFNYTSNKIPEVRTQCKALGESVAITWDGKVVPCCRDYDASYVYGNVRNYPLKTIFESSHALTLRDNETSINPCAKCNEWFITMDRKVNKV